MNPVDTLGFGERKRREKRKRRCCGGGTHTSWGVLLLLRTVPEFGATVAKTCGTASGGRIKWGGIYFDHPDLLFSTFPAPFIHGK